jgi:pyrroline-5-carboxylate reductase
MTQATQKTETLRLLILGGGNMAQAILAGLKRSGLATNIRLVEPVEALHATLRQTCGLPETSLFTNLHAAFEQTPLHQFDWLVLAVKPQQAQEALTPVLAQTQLPSSQIDSASMPALLSIAAGLSISSLQAWSGLNATVRCMPNTPAMVGQGITGLYAPIGLEARHRQQSDELMRGLGPTVWLTNEDEINTVTAISGSGPAYVFYFVECFTKAAQETGLPAETAQQLAWQTVKGAVALLDASVASGESAESLRAKVTSKGGTTAAAMERLGAAGLQQTLATAIAAAQTRARELS